MPRTRQGQSVSTIDKERQLAGTLAMDMAIVKYKCPDETFYHFDLNAGSGWNDEYGVPGTPLVFLELAEKYLKRWEAMFFEIDQERAKELANRLRGIPHCRVESIDNRHFMEWAGKLPPRSLGTVLTDPNGWLLRSAEGMGSPVEEMIQCFGKFQRMDLIANLNLRHYLMVKGDRRHHPEKRYGRVISLPEMPRVFQKRFGLISNISSSGHGQFVRLVLRNMRTNDYKALGWNQLDSPKALQIYRYAEADAEERRFPGQMGLFGETA